MEYRNWNKNNISTSLLGFGCMRLPKTPDGAIDEPRAAALLNAARNAGVNYFDTAYPYHGGESEPFVGRTIAQWPRESFYLATKLPLWLCKTLDDAKRIFEEQLQRLGVEYFDFYLMHALHKSRYDAAKEIGIVDWLWEQKAAGRIRNLGFSFHDNYAALEHIIRDQPWDFCQLQYNYLDTDDRAEEQAGDRGYALAAELDIPVIVMEPIKGGTLANLPPDAAAPLRAMRPDLSMASWALRWVGTHPNVKVILSGMSDEAQVTDNLSTFERFAPLTDAESAAVSQVAEVLRSRIRIGCTGCRYCMPCPMGVDIPDNFSAWNRYAMFGQADAARESWHNRFPEQEKAKNCVRCGKCEAACPQHLPIRDALAQLQQEMDAL
ncbi:MAG: aldo/keto reductase [Faecalibacterium sp.]